MGGILTGIAALITAILGVLTFLDRSGAVENPVGHSISKVLPASGGTAGNHRTVIDDTTAVNKAKQGNITDTSVTASPSSGTATDCSGAGVLITFTGTITATGAITANDPLTVKYHWEGSDGAIASTPEPLVLTEAGSKTVQTTWHRWGSSGETLSGAQKLVIDEPDEKSDEASFNILCTGNQTSEGSYSSEEKSAAGTG